MEEQVEVPISSVPDVVTPATEEPAVIADLEEDVTTTEEFSVLEKGFFFAAIIGCVALYMKMKNRKNKRYLSKSKIGRAHV